MTDRLNLPLPYRRIVEALLREHVPDAEVWAYGSCVTGENREGSDLDLVVRGPELKPLGDGFFQLVEAIEKSNIPILVQAHDWALLPESFHAEIERDYVVLVEKKEQSRPALDLATADEAAPLQELLAYTRDGEWGAGEKNANLTPMRVIRGTDFEAVRRGSLTNVPTRYIRPEASARKTLKPWDILIETAGGSKNRPTGRTLLVHPRILERSEIPVTCASFARFLRIHCDRANPAYIYWFLQYLYTTGEMEKHQVQHTGIARFQFTDFAANIEVPLPPLSEQRAIAHILGTLDDKIELNRRMNETLEEMARALFKSWFVDFLPVHAKQRARTQTGDPVRTKAALKAAPSGGGDWTVERASAYLDSMDKDIIDLFPDRLVDSELGEIPDGWEVKSLGKICEKPQYGYTQSAKTEPIGPKFLRITDINKQAWIEWQSVPHCEITKEDFEKYRLKRGDILIARMADPGHGCMVEEAKNGVFASYLIRFRPIQQRYWNLIQYWLRSEPYWNLVRGRRTGTTRNSLNAKVLSEFTLVVPPGQLLDFFGLQVRKLREYVVANVNESETLTAHRDVLLPKLLNGEVGMNVENTTL